MRLQGLIVTLVLVACPSKHAPPAPLVEIDAGTPTFDDSPVVEDMRVQFSDRVSHDEMAVVVCTYDPKEHLLVCMTPDEVAAVSP